MRQKLNILVLAVLAIAISTVMPVFGQTAVKPDTLRIEFPLGSSVISAKYNSKIAEAKEKIAAGWTAEIYGGANEVGWKDESAGKSGAFNGGEADDRSKSVARALGLEKFTPGVLTGDMKSAMVILNPPAPQPAVIDTMNIKKMVSEVVDAKVGALRDEVDEALLGVNARIDAVEEKVDKIPRWSYLAGWQGVSFGNRRDLSVASAGLRFSTGRFYAEVGGGLDPKARPGYDDVWFRDYLATARLGVFVWKNIALEIGGLGGWEATSDTDPNSFVMQVLGVTAGLKGEVSVTNIGPVNISAHAGASFVYAEVNDMAARIAPMRNGVAGSAGATITF